MSLVLDSSVALSWCFADERTVATQALLERVGASGAVAPRHWPIEVVNGLVMAERRQRIDAPRRRQLADFLRDLPIAYDEETFTHVWAATQKLAERFRLTMHDAIYLELAGRRRLPLASFDRELCRAAGSFGVEVVGSPTV